MFSQVFLAVTAREMETFLPSKLAYMACHFSAGGAGLSNLPSFLPDGSLLLLDDSMPVQGHDSDLVITQLQDLFSRFSLRGILLDFQRPVTPEATEMASAVLACCLGAATPEYAGSHPVFLPPPPVNQALADYLHPWKDRGVYLEIAPESVQFTVTEKGSSLSSIFPDAHLPMQDNRLRCHYGVSVFPDKAVFALTRTREDLANLCKDAEKEGVLATVGLFQELQNL